MAKFWKAKETIVKHDAAADVTISTSAALDTFFSGGTVMQNLMKNVTVVEPESDVSLQNFIGVDANGYQNVELDEQPYTKGSLSGTMVLTTTSNLEQYAYGAATTISTTHTRFLPGKVGARVPMSILVNMDIATGGIGSGSNDSVNFVLDNAWVTKMGETRLSDVASHWERDIMVMCLPRDFHGPEYEDQ